LIKQTIKVLYVSKSPPFHLHLIRAIVEHDLADNNTPFKKWVAQAMQRIIHYAPDTAKIRTRFPPELNGYL
jgi:hypothetical protein